MTTDRYTLVRLLGTGGMGEVWEAILHGPGGFAKQVALKRVTQTSLSPEAGQQLLEEARVGALLQHPNIVGVYAIDSDGAQWRIAMELVDGATVRDLLAAGPLPPAAVVEIGLQTAAALEQVHALRVGGRPLVHRDVKPQNLLVDRHGTVKLADFGVAAAGWGTSAGTAGYAPAEQLEGRSEPRSDLFALGMTLAACALGRRPLGRANEALAGVFGIEARLPGLRAAVDAAAPGLGDVVAGCLRLRPDDRYPDAAALGAALRDLRVSAAPGPGLRDALARVRPDLRLAPAPLPMPGARRAGNLPGGRDGFVGRDEELGDLDARLARGERLVTLLGPGGAGKTRLSLEAARRAQARYPGGAWFVDLSEAHTADGVRFAVARVFGLELSGSDDQVGGALRHRGPVLLVMDNLEQVVAGAAPLVSGWLSEAPELTVLATSRIALDVRGEHLAFLGPLPDGPAVALFLERSGRTDPVAEVAPVVRLLEGSPLAIELAAARAGNAPLELLRDRLRKGLLALSTSRRDLPDRQRSLEASLTWSWELLSPWGRAALSQLTVCEGGFDVRAAEALLELSRWPEASWTLDVLQELVHASLVRVDRATGRFSLLVSVRAFAAARLPDDERRSAELRHARWYAQCVGGAPSLVEVDNLAAAVERAASAGFEQLAADAALAAWPVFFGQGPLPVGVRLLERVHALFPADRPHLSVVLALSRGYDETGRVLDAEAVVRAAIAATPDPSPDLLHGLARPLLSRAAFEEAEPLLDRALILYRRAGDRHGTARACGSLALLRFQRGDNVGAHDELKRALEAAEGVDDPLLQGRLLCELGVVVGQAGDGEASERHLRHAQQVLEATGQRQPLIVVLINLASTLAVRGRTAEARAAFLDTLAVQRELGCRANEGVTLTQLGTLELKLGHLQEAGGYLGQALQIHHHAPDPAWEGYTLYQLARLAWWEGRTSDGLEFVHDARVLPGQRPDDLGRLSLVEADLQLARGRTRECRELLVAILAEHPPLLSPMDLDRARAVLGEALLADGDATGAAEQFELARRGGRFAAVVPATLGLARLTAAGGGDASELLAGAEKVVRESAHPSWLAEVLATRAELSAGANPVGAGLALDEALAVTPTSASVATRQAIARARAALGR